MKKLAGGLSNVPGYKFSAIKSGIRYENRLDFSIISSVNQCNAAGMFTTNKLFAAPVKLCKDRINNPINSILINSTNANACTGSEGLETAEILTKNISEILKVPESSILMASTGIIGVQLPREKMQKQIPDLISKLSLDSGSIVAEAIMTTDTAKKESAYSFETSKGNFNIAGIAKGSGMIAPNMATMLSFIITDAPIKKEIMQKIFEKCIHKTFNAITVDGDMSTNDTAILLSPIKDFSLEQDDDIEHFEKALFAVIEELAKKIVKDGEGATKCVKISVENAQTEKDAKSVAKSVAESLLVKTAIFGGDPNWGRIACAVGYANANFDINSVSISFDNIEVYKNGMPTNFDLKKVEQIFKKTEFEVIINLQNGNSNWCYLTSDISYDYVKINAEYST